MVLHGIAIVPAFVVSITAVLAQTVGTEQGREIPAYALPVPDDISPQMRPLVAAPPAPWDIHPKSIAEWKELVAKVAAPAKTLLPVLGVPMPSRALNGIDSLLSIVQMPKGVPVGTLAIGKAGAVNAALLAASILALHDKALAERVSAWRKKQTEAVAERPEESA